MNASAIFSDPATFIPDRYFSSKSKHLPDMDMYKDRGRILSFIAAADFFEATPLTTSKVLPSLSASPRKKGDKNNPKLKHKHPHRIVKQNTQQLKAANASAISDPNQSPGIEPVQNPNDSPKNENKTPAAVAENKVTPVAPVVQVENKSGGSTEVKPAGNGETQPVPPLTLNKSEDFTEDNELSMWSPQNMLEKSKEVIRQIESPADIYNRFVDLKPKRDSRGNIQSNRTGVQRLKGIAKKLDLTVEIANTAQNAKALNLMKKLPFEYYQKARASATPAKRDQVDGSLEEPKPRELQKERRHGPRIIVKLDSLRETGNQTQNNIVEDLNSSVISVQSCAVAKNNGSALKSSTSVTTGDQSLLLLPKELNQKKFQTLEVGKPQQEKSPLLTPISVLTQSNISQRMSMDNSAISAVSAVPELSSDLRESGFNKDMLSRRTTTFKNDMRAQWELRHRDKRVWVANKVSDLGQVITSLKGDTLNDLGRLNSFKREMRKDTERLEKKRLRGPGDDQGTSDKDYYEDALNDKMNKLTNGSFLMRNCVKIGSQLKNKKEREVEHVRFEKQMAKVEKKVGERLRAKSTAPLNSKR